MRKSFNGLAGLVQSKLRRNPTSGEVFIFINRRRDRIKLLHWETGGFTLYYKRLERGTFEVPQLSQPARQISWPELMLLVSGISLKHVQQRARFALEKTP
jgi:transposase